MHRRVGIREMFSMSGRFPMHSVVVFLMFICIHASATMIDSYLSVFTDYLLQIPFYVLQVLDLPVQVVRSSTVGLVVESLSYICTEMSLNHARVWVRSVSILKIGERGDFTLSCFVPC